MQKGKGKEVQDDFLFRFMQQLSDAQIKQLLWFLPKWQMTRLSKLTNQVKAKKYPKVEVPLYEQAGEEPIPTPEELSAFFSVVDNARHKLMFETQMQLCLRPSELLELEWKHIDFTRSIARIATKKQSVPVLDEVPVPRPLLEELKVHKTWTDKFGSPWVFPSVNKGHYLGKRSINGYRALFYKYKQKVGIEDVYAHSKSGKPLQRFHLHSFRHLGITQAWRNMKSKDIKLLAKLSRHRSLRHASRYVHTELEQLVQLANRTWSCQTRDLKFFGVR